MSKQYKCGHCGLLGHNARSCDQRTEAMQAESALRADLRAAGFVAKKKKKKYPAVLAVQAPQRKKRAKAQSHAQPMNGIIKELIAELQKTIAQYSGTP